MDAAVPSYGHEMSAHMASFRGCRCPAIVRVSGYQKHAQDMDDIRPTDRARLVASGLKVGGLQFMAAEIHMQREPQI